MPRLTDRIAIVTGAASGIGRATARLMAAEGAAVIATDLDVDGLATLAEEAATGGLAIRTLRHDVSEAEGWAAATAMAEDAGGLDILVNNAGVFHITPFEEASLGELRLSYRVNVEGVFLGMQACLGLLRASAARRDATAAIINLSSSAALIGYSNSASYAAAKGAVRTISRAAAIEFGQKGYRIRVNSVHPGFIETPLSLAGLETLVTRGLVPDVETARLGVIAAHPIGRLGRPVDVAQAILFLSSDESAFITGTELVVDGGHTAS
jgi:NAD(P)-dependent dehydrogenase (short-subunit alcohol dehydrogenase family)